MVRIILERLRQKSRTSGYPRQEVELPDKFRGLPKINQEACKTCKDRQCYAACPTAALTGDAAFSLDLGRCIFCTECASACKNRAIGFTSDFHLAARDRRDLVLTGKELIPVRKLENRMLKLFGRSLKLREVSAGGCNACEADTNVLNTLFYDLGRFGIQFVASPRHADGLFITGPVTRNMELALKKTYAAIPGPKLVIAAGTCAVSGGLFRDHPETNNGADSIVPVDLYIPGCPPHPLTILDGLLRLLDKL
ncbi:MAG: hydrogenase [Chitinispirillaceae bacterium]|jgi:Ni,Fe-hydrogenase III small subunit/NAD-dependent dihydropyrimidine dehydrogenase PreA subunit